MLHHDDGAYQTSLVRFSKLDFSTTKRVVIPNHTSPESSWRDVWNADRFGTDTDSTVEISRVENRPQGAVIYIVNGTWYVPGTRYYIQAANAFVKKTKCRHESIIYRVYCVLLGKSL